jgi:putative oxidoreductase
MSKGIDYEVWAPRILTVLRIMVGLLFLEHGTQKVLGFPASAIPGPALISLGGIQGLIELVGGVLIVIGLFTRPVAFILCGDMAVAYFMSHAPNSFFPIANRGDAAILYCFVFLYLAVAGGGAWSLDASRRKS